MRGYGSSDRPEAVEAFDIFQLTGDIVGIVNAVGGGPAAIAGHDWGAWIASYLAMLRSDLFRAMALLSVPYVPRRRMNQSDWERGQYPGKIFYQAMLRAPGSEAYFQADPRAMLLRAFYTLSGEVAPEDQWRPARDPGPASPPMIPESKRPGFLTAEDLD